MIFTPSSSSSRTSPSPSTLFFLVSLAATSASAAAGPYTTTNASAAFPPFTGDPFVKYNISANGIHASFIPYGARITNLFVHDRHGHPQDVVVGYDQGVDYLRDTETNHTYFGAVVGRYANRIKNGTFTLHGQTSHIPENENSGKDTLHGGFVGYDQQNWTVAAHTNSSITFSFLDAAQSGFPGTVLNLATYTLSDEPAWTSRLVSIPLTDATPIMLANHVYWNLGAFVDRSALSVLANTLYMPLAKRVIDIDGIEVPTGQISVTHGTPLDFTQPHTRIGARINETLNNCGTGCIGYDNGFILDRSPYAGVYDAGAEVLQLYAPQTGIELRLHSNQQGLQIYSCNGQNGTIPVKSGQQHLGNRTAFVEKFGCLVIETQDWIGGINYPEWGRELFQIFETTSAPAVNLAKYVFSVKG